MVLRGWMRRVFVNTILEHFRKRRKFQFISEEMEESQEEVMDENLERLFDDSISEILC